MTDLTPTESTELTYLEEISKCTTLSGAQTSRLHALREKRGDEVEQPAERISERPMTLIEAARLADPGTLRRAIDELNRQNPLMDLIAGQRRMLDMADVTPRPWFTFEPDTGLRFEDSLQPLVSDDAAEAMRRMQDRLLFGDNGAQDFQGLEATHTGFDEASSVDETAIWRVTWGEDGVRAVYPDTGEPPAKRTLHQRIADRWYDFRVWLAEWIVGFANRVDPDL